MKKNRDLFLDLGKGKGSKEVFKELNNIVDYASYSTLRAIASYIDGFKNSQRKVFYGFYEYINKNIKVEQASNKIASITEYLHGANNLNGVIIKMTQSFTGKNNISYFIGDGNFGSRYEPMASAPRYIFIEPNPIIRNIYKEEDKDILISQYFEGNKIEPRFYIPIIPMILVNGSEGIAMGFSQKILPRNPKEIIKNIINYLDNGNINKMKPYFKGFKGKIKRKDNSYIIYGNIKSINKNKIHIDEMPINFTLKKALSFFDILKQKGIIISYEDYSEEDKFNFIIKVRDVNNNKDYWLDRLGLYYKVSENFTTIDKNNKIRIFKDERELLEEFIKIRLYYYNKRKEYILQKINNNIEDKKLISSFIDLVLNGDINIINESEKDINKILQEKLDIGNDKVKELLSLNLNKLTKEKINKLQKEIKELVKKYKVLKNKDINEIYKEELNKIYVSI